ncbi:hypothetical protein, partial [Klebsiella michiganensis]
MQSIDLNFFDWPPNWRLLSFLSRQNFRTLDYRKNNISFKVYTNQFSCKDREGANKQVISSQADSLIKIS